MIEKLEFIAIRQFHDQIEFDYLDSLFTIE